MGRRTLSETAPMLIEPGICRWCRGRLRALLDDGPADYCQNGCEKNHQGTYLAHCSECERDFKTGLPGVQAVRCWSCTKVEDDVIDRDTATRRTGYEHKKFGRGHWTY